MMLHTYQSGYVKFGSIGDGQDITAEGTILDGKTAGYTYDYTDMPINNISIPEEANGVILTFAGYDVCDLATFGAKIWGYAKRGDNNTEAHAELIADICGAIANDACYIDDISNNKFAATLSVNTDGNIKSVSAYDSGNNRIAKISFDAVGYDMLALEWYDITNTDEIIDATGYAESYIRWY